MMVEMGVSGAIWIVLEACVSAESLVRVNDRAKMVLSVLVGGGGGGGGKG